MKNLNALAPVVALALGVSCNSQDVKPKTEDDKTFYAMGSLMGTRLKSINLQDAEINMIVQGLRDSAKGQKPQIDLQNIVDRFKMFSEKEWKKNTDKFKDAGKKYMEKYIAGGGKKSDKGFAYKDPKSWKRSKAKSNRYS